MGTDRTKKNINSDIGHRREGRNDIFIVLVSRGEVNDWSHGAISIKGRIDLTFMNRSD